MPLLNDANSVYLGSQAVDKVYQGSTLVWQSSVGTYCYLDASPDAVIAGQTVTIYNDVYLEDNSDMVNEGDVQFYRDGIALGAPVPIIDFRAQITDVPLTEGVVSYSSLYLGTSKYQSSEGYPTNVQVLPPTPSAPQFYGGGFPSVSAITLNWTPPIAPASATGYRLICRAGTAPTGPLDPFATVLLNNAPLTTLQYVHSGLASSTTYHYLICCNSPVGYGLDDRVSYTTDAPPIVPGPPTGLRNSGGGLWSCWTYVYFNCPANIPIMSARGYVSTFEGHWWPNSPPGHGGNYDWNVLWVWNDTNWDYMKIATALSGGPTFGYSVFVIDKNTGGLCEPANITFTIGISACYPLTMADYEAMDAVYGNVPESLSEVFAQRIGESLPTNLEEAWACVDRRLAAEQGQEGEITEWWLKLWIACDVLYHWDHPSFDAMNTKAGIPPYEPDDSETRDIPTILSDTFTEVEQYITDRNVSDLSIAIEKSTRLQGVAI